MRPYGLHQEQQEARVANIVVVQTQFADGEPATYQVISGAESTTVADGHLILHKGQRYVAAYAPGSWQRFYRQDAVVPRESATKLTS
jgi:hypothetical protein